MAVAKALHASDCEILYSDPSPLDPKAVSQLGSKSVTLEELLARSDVATIHAPLIPGTQGCGGIVNEAALAEALCSGRLGSATVDVYSAGPPQAPNALLSFEGETAHRLLLTPHVAGVTLQAQAALFRQALENVERVLAHGLLLLNRVY